METNTQMDRQTEQSRGRNGQTDRQTQTTDRQTGRQQRQEQINRYSDKQSEEQIKGQLTGRQRQSRVCFHWLRKWQTYQHVFCWCSAGQYQLWYFGSGLISPSMLLWTIPTEMQSRRSLASECSCLKEHWWCIDIAHVLINFQFSSRDFTWP